MMSIYFHPDIQIPEIPFTRFISPILYDIIYPTQTHKPAHTYGGTEHMIIDKWKRLSFYWKSVLIFSAFVLLSLLLSRIPSFCDFYTDHIFPLGLQTYGRITGLFPFSAGEILIAVSGVLVLLQIVLVLLLLAFHPKKRRWKTATLEKTADAFPAFVIRYSKCMLAFVLLVIWIMTANCATLYNCSKLAAGGSRDTTYSFEEIREVRNMIVEQCNTLSTKMKRDANGNVVTDGNINEKIKSAMRGLSAEYPRLSGYYPTPKPVLGSFFMYQAGYDGVYFPFSLEANYNTYISDIRYPHVACHELAHLKGYIYEDEADFIAYLACVGSDDEQLQYAGYLGVLHYIDSDYRNSAAIQQTTSEETFSNGTSSGEIPLPSVPAVEISDLVHNDSGSYTAETKKELSTMPELIDTETVASVSKGFTDAYMDYYGAEPNYAEVTKLLLAYYHKT